MAEIQEIDESSSNNNNVISMSDSTENLNQSKKKQVKKNRNKKNTERIPVHDRLGKKPRSKRVDDNKIFKNRKNFNHREKIPPPTWIERKVPRPVERSTPVFQVTSTPLPHFGVNPQDRKSVV